MAGKLLKLKPSASRSIHLLVAASMWTAVGMALLSRGVSWLNGIGQLWIVLPGVIIGSIKSLIMLDRSAKKSIKRIITTRDGRCIGGVYSVKTWLLVLLMMIAGGLMRNSTLPKEFLGLFYVAIGWGLLFSSRHAWLAWKNGDDSFTGKDKAKEA